MVLRNAWFAAMWAQELVGGSMVPRRILNEPIVIYRLDDGSIAAIGDHCPHRFAPLHKGKLLPGGVVRCGYHGLEFDSSGTCIRNPHGECRIPAQAKVPAYPSVEQHTLIWIWMGDGKPDRTLIPDYSLFDRTSPERMSKRDWIVMDASWELITENLLDLSHASYLHDGLLGNEETIPAATEVREDENTLYVSRWMPGVTPPGMMDMMFRRDGQKVDLWADMRWNAPGCMLNDTGVTGMGQPRSAGTGIFGAHILTPSTPTTTYYHFAAVPQNPMPWLFDDPHVLGELSRLRRMAFEEQDEPMIRAQQAAVLELGERAKPLLLSVDAGAVRYKRILQRMAEAHGAPTEKPAKPNSEIV